MLKDREKIEQTLTRYMRASGYLPDTRKQKEVHALSSWVFVYTNCGGNKDNLKIEINYSMRNHILPIVSKKITVDFLNVENEIKTLAKPELFASKIKALLERTATRDLYDVHNMIDKNIIKDSQRDILRKGVVFYQTVGSTGKFIEAINYNEFDNLSYAKVRKTLTPLLKKNENIQLDTMKSEVKEYLQDLLQFTMNENEYIDSFAKGIYSPELLFDNQDIIKRVANHPMAIWKVSNI